MASCSADKVRITRCILTLNEQPCVEVVWPLLPSQDVAAGFDRVVVIDSGSTDGTVEYFQDRGVRVLAQKTHGGGAPF